MARLEWLRRSLCIAVGASLSLVGAAVCSTPSESDNPPPPVEVERPAATDDAPLPVLRPDDARGFLLYQLPGAVLAAAVRSTTPYQETQRALRCTPERFARARSAWLDDDPLSTTHLLSRVSECDDSALRDRALLLYAEASLEQHHHGAALDALNQQGNDSTLAMSHVAMIRAAALRGLDRPDEALPHYQSVLDDRDSLHHHRARVERAITLSEAARFKEAEQALGAVIDDYPEHPRVERLILLRGRARLALKRFREAAADFDRVVFQWPYKEAAADAQAMLTMLAVGKGIFPHARTLRARMSRARSLRINKHWRIAEETYRELLEEATSPSRTSPLENRIEYQLALNYYGPSDYLPAIEILERLADRIDAGSGAGLKREEVFDSLVDCHAYAGQYEEALAALQRWIAPLDELERSERLAKFYEDNARFDLALALREELRSATQKSTWKHGFLLHKAGRYAEATRTFAQLVKVTRGRHRKRYRYWHARSLMKDQKLKRAAKLFESLHTDAPLDYYGYQAHNRWLEIERAREKPGERPPHAAPTRPSGDGVLLANGETHADALSGQTQASAPLSPSSIRDPSRAPWRPSQPSLTWSSSGGSKPTLTGSGRVHWLRSPFGRSNLHATREEIGEDLDRVQGNFKPAYESSEPIRGALARAAALHQDLFPRLEHAAFLYSAGFETDARQILRGVLLEYRALERASKDGQRPSTKSPVALGVKRDEHYIDNRKRSRGYWGIRSDDLRFPIPTTAEERSALSKRQEEILARRGLKKALRLAGKEAGDFHLVRRWAYRKPFTKSDPTYGKYRESWMEAHPRAYPRLVQNHSRRNALPPYLMWGIMTVESSYNPDSISHADARGLLQVIPRTGIKVASSMGVDDYGPHDLLDERMSIRFGTWYLAQLVHKFHGQEPLAIAGYNGGPHNVARWLTMRGHALELDEFIETIPFDQARLYVKKVLRFIGIYRRIYERESTLYVGNALDPTFEVDPNY